VIGPRTARAWHVIGLHGQHAGDATMGFPVHSAGQAFKPKTSVASFRLVFIIWEHVLFMLF